MKKSISYKDSGFAYTMSLISDKYKLSILYSLARYGTVRYNELKRFLEPISFKITKRRIFNAHIRPVMQLGRNKFPPA